MALKIGNLLVCGQEEEFPLKAGAPLRDACEMGKFQFIYYIRPDLGIKNYPSGIEIGLRPLR